MNNIQEAYCHRRSNKYDGFLKIIILSLAFGDIASPLLLSRIIAVIFLPILFKDVVRCEYTKSFKTFFYFLMIYSIFSLAWTYNFTEGCKGIAYNCIHFALFFEVLVFCRFANNSLRSISTGWLLAVLFLSVIAVWEIVTGNHLPLAYEETQTINIGGVISQRMLANATFTNYNAFVKFLCFALPWLFYRMSISYKERITYVLSIVTLILTILIILINGSRGGLLCLVLVAGIYIFFMPKGKASFFTSVLFFGGLIFMLIKFGEQIFLVLSMKSQSQGLASDSSRIEIWTACIKALIKSLGLGSGIGGVSGAIESVSPNIIKVPHNMIVEAFLEYGLVIGLIFLVYLIRLFKKSIRMTNEGRKMAVLMALISMPMFCIIDSLYLKSPDTFILLATIIVFTNYEYIRSFCK